jgi:hypothetical protein
MTIGEDKRADGREVVVVLDGIMVYDAMVSHPPQPSESLWNTSLCPGIALHI